VSEPSNTDDCWYCRENPCKCACDANDAKRMAAIRLYVDDIRRCPDGWTLARTNTQAIQFLHSQNVMEISIDHDICFYHRQGRIIATVDETFRPVAYYIAAMMPEVRPKKITLHSANPHGAQAMKMILNDAGVECEIKLGSYVIPEGEPHEQGG